MKRMKKIILGATATGAAATLILVLALFFAPRPVDTTEARVFQGDSSAIDYCRLPELTGPAVKADDIPKAYTPGRGYETFPRPILANCTEPLSPGSADLRGLWQAYTGLEGHIERIEQCGNRVVVTSGGVIHDFRTDGTLKNGANDIEPPLNIRTWSSEEFVDGVLTHYAFGLIPVVRRYLDGHELVWTYPGHGETRMKRICKLPPTNDKRNEP
jgi:hypothetical protein